MKQILSNRTGVILISIIWGLGLSAIFRKVCKGRGCILIKAPDPNDVKKQVYQYDKKCYKYKPYTVKCTENTIKS